MAEAQAQNQAAEAYTQEGSLLDQIVDEGRLGRDAATKERGKDLVKNFVSEVLKGTVTLNADTEAMINARIAQIDALISSQLNEVMHHPDFQKLEGTWRGLKYLLNNTETSTQLKIKVFNVNKKDLLKDLQKAPEFDQSALFKKVYEEEFGVFRNAVRRVARRLRVRQVGPGHRVARENLAGCRRGARAVHLSGCL